MFYPRIASLLRIRLKTFPVLLAAAVLVACETTGDSVDTVIDFERPRYAPPERTIDDMVRRIRRPSRESWRCSPGYRANVDQMVEHMTANLKSTTTTRTDVAAVLDALESEVGKGNYKTGIEIAHLAIEATSNGQDSGDYWTALGRIHASIGDIEAADDARWGALNAWNVRNTNRVQYLDSLLRAEIALASGDINLAEQFYYAAIDALARGPEYTRRGNMRGLEWSIHFAQIDAGLATIALHRGELAESERFARKAVLGTYGVARYSSRTAAMVQLLARILVEQGRLTEVEELLRLAIDMHEYVCAESGILSFARAHAVVAQLKMADGDWAGALADFESVERSLAGDPETFLRLYGANPEWILALIKTGQPDRAAGRLERSIVVLEARYGPDSYEVAEATGLLGVARHAAADRVSALRAFRQAVPRLLDAPIDLGGRAGPPSRNERLRLILESYLMLLHELRGPGVNIEIDVDPAVEMFRIANAARGQRVNATVAAAAARGVAGDPELASFFGLLPWSHGGEGAVV